MSRWWGPVNVINEITADLAAASALGVPLTHRDHAHGVVIVTGHAKPGSTGTDWRALATAIIENATLHHHRQAVCTLVELQSTIVRAQLASPSVIVVDDVSQGLLAAGLYSSTDGARAHSLSA